jgi:hypothetical protein
MSLADLVRPFRDGIHAEHLSEFKSHNIRAAFTAGERRKRLTVFGQIYESNPS